MKIIVTGGAGFIGGNFVIKQVLKENNEVLNYDKLTYAGNLDTLTKLADHPNYQFIQADICDRHSVKSQLEGFQPDCIVHFAAESHVDRSIDGPFIFIQTNIVGTAVLLNESYHYYKTLLDDKKDKFSFLHVSTDEVFGSLDKKGYFTEQTAYDPSSPYSASKASSDHLARAWHRTYSLPVLITNCSNCSLVPTNTPVDWPEALAARQSDVTTADEIWRHRPPARGSQHIMWIRLEHREYGLSRLGPSRHGWWIACTPQATPARLTTLQHYQDHASGCHDVPARVAGRHLGSERCTRLVWITLGPRE